MAGGNSFVVFLTFDSETEFVTWKLSASKDSLIVFTQRSVQKKGISPQLSQRLCQRRDDM